MEGNGDFIESARQMLTTFSADAQAFVVNIDVNNFHSIKYIYSADEGDELLQTIEAFLRTIPEIKYCVRTSEDFFLCLFLTDRGTEVQTLMRKSDLAIQALLDDFERRYPAFKCRAACGICPVEAGDLARAIDGANIARKESKKQLTTKSVLYNPALHQKSVVRSQMEQLLHDALIEKRFSFYLQPKVNLLTGEIVGAEALARRIDAEGKVVYPDTFLHLMEENGDIIALDFLIYRQVCSFLASLIEQNQPVVPISVNLSMLHLQNANTAKQLHEIAEGYHIPPQLLEFELTETILVTDFAQVKAMTDELRSYGYSIAIDDFGAGYAGISIWQELNFDLLKLDRKFLATDGDLLQRNSALVPNLIDISKRLNTAVLCEGVETEEQCQYLASLGCTLAQGFYFAMPMPAQKFLEEYHEVHGVYPLPQAAEPTIATYRQDSDKKQSKALRTQYSFKYILSILVLASLLVFFIIAALNITKTNTHGLFESLTTNTLNAYMQGQKEKTVSRINNISDTLNAIAVVIADNQEPNFINASISTLNESSDDVVYMYASFEDIGVSPLSGKDDELWARLKKGETVVTEIRPSKEAYYFGIAVPVEREGDYVGTVYGVINANMLISTDLYNAAQGKIVQVMLTEEDGFVLPGMSTANVGVGERLSERLAYKKDVPKDIVAELEKIYAQDDGEAHSLFIGKDEASRYYLSVVGLGLNGWHLALYMADSINATIEQQIISRSTVTILVQLFISLLLFALIILFYRRIYQHIRKNERRYDLLESFTDTVLFEFDRASDTLEFTPNASRLIRLDSPSQKNFGKNLGATYIYPGDYENIRRLFSGGAGIESGECRLRVMRPDSSAYFWCLVQCKYIYQKDKLVSVVGKLTDIDKTVQNEAQLRQMAETDNLTGLKNKRTVEKIIEEQLTHNRCGFLLVFDMDGFKQINDRYGHAAGDLLLRHMGKSITRTFRADDVGGRIGGDEMLVYMKNTCNPEIIEQKVAILNRYIALYAAENGVPCSISIGVSAFPEDGSDFQTLFAAADQALYAAKRQGKNQFCVYADIKDSAKNHPS